MNTKELIDCLKYCANDETDCLGCERWEYDYGSARCVDNLMELAADRLAALESELIDERYRHDRYADYTRGLEKKLAQAKAGSRWIPVTERLPQEDLPIGAVCDLVQVLLQNGLVTVGWCNRGLKCWYYYPEGETRYVGHGYDLTPVIAWAPLLEPPKEVASDV